MSYLTTIENSDSKVIGMFLATKSTRSEKTANVYSGAINEFFRFLNYKSLRQINYSDLLEYVDYLNKPNPLRKPVVLAISTQNRKIVTVKSLFKYAMRIGYITLNPAEPITTKRIDSRVAQRLLMPSELEALLCAAVEAGTVQTLIVFFFAVTGCRVSELAGIRWADFFLGAKSEICVSVTGKGNKNRILKIPDSLWRLIVQYRHEIGLCARIDPQNPSPFLVNSRDNPYTPLGLWEIIKKLKNAAGIGKNISPHWLRHTFATEVAKDENANLWQLQHDMGHANITTTQHYVHIARGMKDTSVDHLQYLSSLEKHI
jgi:site-specific recombinase XerD